MECFTDAGKLTRKLSTDFDTDTFDILCTSGCAPVFVNSFKCRWESYSDILILSEGMRRMAILLLNKLVLQ